MERRPAPARGCGCRVRSGRLLDQLEEVAVGVAEAGEAAGLGVLDLPHQLDAAADDLVFNPAFPTSGSKTIYQLVPALCAQDQFVGDRLPSLLSEERDAEWVASGLTVKRKKPIAEKIRIETRRIVEWISDFCRLRQYRVIPLDPPAAEDQAACRARLQAPYPAP